MSFLEKLQWRYATKKFDTSKKLSKEKLDSLLTAIQYAPSSYGLQSFKVLVVEDPAIRAKLRDAAHGQTQLTDASQVIVFATETVIDEALVHKYVDLIAHTRNIDKANLADYAGYMAGTVNNTPDDKKIIWSAKQTYIALGFLLAAAAELEIDACPMEGFDVAKFDEILGLTAKGLTATVIAPIGYRSAEDGYSQLAKVRKAKADLFIHI